MNTTIYTTADLKALILEIFFNKQSKVTKVSDESALNAIMYGASRVGQKAMKDIAIVESHILPNTATGTQLEECGVRYGVGQRLGASGSSTYLLIIADPGTTYLQSSVTFSGQHGIVFELEENVTVFDSGYTYAKVRSTVTGSRSNVDANSIITVTPQPSGHIAVINEFIATGGRDTETDEDYRQRIISRPNIQAKTTLTFLAELFRSFNSDVLYLQNKGFDTDGVINLVVVLQNGTDLTVSELDELLDNTKEYFTLTDLNKNGEVIGVKLLNPTWYAVNGSTGVDFRVQLYENYNPDQVRKNIQVAMSRYLDLKSWKEGDSVQWDDLLDIVKQTQGVRYVPDSYFYPGSDLLVPAFQLPRIQRFVMRDMDGNIISDAGGNLSSIFYPI